METWEKISWFRVRVGLVLMAVSFRVNGSGSCRRWRMLASEQSSPLPGTSIISGMQPCMYPVSYICQLSYHTQNPWYLNYVAILYLVPEYIRYTTFLWYLSLIPELHNVYNLLGTSLWYLNYIWYTTYLVPHSGTWTTSGIQPATWYLNYIMNKTIISSPWYTKVLP